MRKLHTNKVITRRNWQTDTYYVCPDQTVFVTPDGVGAYFYDSLDEAEEEYPLANSSRMVILYTEPDLDTNP